MRAALLTIHVASGTLALILGPVAMLLPKRPRRHPRVGLAYQISVAVLFVSAIGLTAMHAVLWGLDVIVAATWASALAGWWVRRHQPRGWRSLHMSLMCGSYMLAALFAQDALPRRPGQLTAIVDVLAGELTEPADAAARYLAVWTRLMTSRRALPRGTATVGQRPERASAPAMSAVVPVSPLVPPQARYPARPYYQPAYREPCVPSETHAQAKSEFGQASGFFTFLIGGLMLSVITWLPFRHSGFSFWLIWLCWGGPILPLLTLLPGRSRGSSSEELSAEYVRYEHRRATERLPDWY